MDFKDINQWCIAEGWNIGLCDSDAYYKIDSFGHFMAQDQGKNIATLILIKHSPYFFTLGPFIVHKSYRGQGVGEALWNIAMTRMNQEHPDAFIILHAVAEQVARYQRAGFTPIFTNQRWYIQSKNTMPLPVYNQCTPLTNELLPASSQYYQNHYFTNRELLLRELLLKPETNGLVFIDDNVIKGFGFMRRCVRGFRIGALIADTPEIAQSLIAGLLAFAQNEPVFIDVPESNPNGVYCMNKFHAVREPLEDTITMIKGTEYSSYLKQWEQHYGLFSLEIG